MFKYQGRDKALLESAIDLHKQRMVPSESEAEIETSKFGDIASMKDEELDELTEAIISNQVEQEKIEKGWSA